MNAATADPPVLDLPADLAAALDAAQQDPAAAGGVWVRHPRTGARFRLRRDSMAGAADGPPATTTLLEDVEAAEADIAAGRCVPWEEHRAGRTRHLAELLRANGLDPADHIPADALAEAGLGKSSGPPVFSTPRTGSTSGW